MFGKVAGDHVMRADTLCHLDKRDAALALVTTFKQRLATTSAAADVRRLVEYARNEVLNLQGGARDRPYMARTICQLATGLRRASWTREAIDLISWALDQHVADSFVLTELIVCHLTQQDWDGAERALDRARRLGIVSEAMYAALVAGYGQAGRYTDAQRIFDMARACRVAGPFSHTAMIGACVRAGRLARAGDILRAADAEGKTDACAYATLINAYIRARRTGDVARLSRAADVAGMMSPTMRSQVARALHSAGRVRQARRFERRRSIQPSEGARRDPST
jgi:tetratricopeptide (TPR) repeat protein